MKKTLFSVLVFIIPWTAFSQVKRDLAVSFGMGIFNSPYYTNAQQREFYSLDFDYHIGNRHILSTNFLKGKHRYYDSTHSNNAVPLSTPGYEDNANTDADYLTFSVLYKYKVINKKRFSVDLGAGAGIMTQIILFPFSDGTNVDINFRESTWTDLVFPIRLDADYKLSNHFKLGLLGGLYFHPDYPILGYHSGFRLSYIIK